MKIGDLVTLSAAGRQRNGNWSVRKGIGIIVQINSMRKYPIVCEWPLKTSGSTQHHFKRYELKKVKKSS